ncbi:MAG: type II CRISPR RNA-guided endonuclease Cas9 [Hydrogenovibrio sp.]|uniref:type II CRISPR RNA-guided endonuclease Cas9 n=1 Tax=Hydrogenovibrio sp. TaxID=2065821 RepID=UPI00286FC291|nr:type II CRISPR RNA-guided endonuclease Cas9 [Hydrogenovibrio sp.]MDR9498163.1 type II CRISPR RNA-guided endonuclease Cas9 [Hydrogenovibrio sp.]
MMKQKLNYRLGLDIGVASVGAALLADDHIVALHVRTFDKAETAKEGESLNKIRRDSRLTRRRIRRRAFRLTRLRRLFHRFGLVDSPKVEAINLAGTSPWVLRAKALDKKLRPEELAFALYHLVKHRGFQSNRKSEVKEDEKAGQMLSGVSRNQALMQERDYQTIGEMVAKDEAFARSKRNKGGDYSHTFARADLYQEVETIFAKQAELGNAYATEELKEQVLKILMARRPALSGEKLLEMVGYCTFETSEYRAPKACYTTERFIWLSKLNNLRILQLGSSRSLTDEERELVKEMPFEQTKVTYKQLRKKLNLDETASFNGLRYDAKSGKNPESADFFVAKYFHALRKAYQSHGLEQTWKQDSQNPEKLDALAYAQTVYKIDDDAREYLQAQGIEETVIEAVLDVSFSEFIRLSLKALHKVLPFMEQGQRYDEAVLSAGYHHHSQTQNTEKTNLVPPLDKGDITNPVVFRAINQTRKLVNAIVKEYGSPMSVHIELARDLNKSFDERRKIEKEQKENQLNRQKDVEEFEKRFGVQANGLNLAKMRLYREQSGQCAYSQKPIDINRLCEGHYVEVDHALPYSRSFDNSFNNKVLVLKAENQNKGNRTPYEYLGGASNDQAWQTYQAWVQATIKNPRKIQKLLRQDFDEKKAEEFRERNLNDTRYAGKVMKNLIENHLKLHDDAMSEKCVVLSGQLTAYLRGKWGLNKVRADGDKHHALDAAVVAACSHSMVKRLSDYARKNELEMVKRDFVDPQTGEVLDIRALRKLESEFPEPWPDFRKELIGRLSDDPAEALQGLNYYTPEKLQSVQPIRVSRMPTRRGLGAAHQETIRSAKCLEDGLSVVKTPLTKLKLKDLDKIHGHEDPRNKPLIDAIRTRLKKFDDKGDKAFASPIYKPSKANGFDPEIEKLDGFSGAPAPRIRSVKIQEKQKSGIAIREGIANNGDMVRIDVFTKSGKYFVVPLYVSDAVKDELPSKAVVQGKVENDWPEMGKDYDYLFSLYPSDWVKVTFKKGDPKEGYYAGMDRSTGNINLWTHDRNQATGKDGLIRSIGIKTAKSVAKYHVDMLGKLYKVHHEERRPLNKG